VRPGNFALGCAITSHAAQQCGAWGHSGRTGRCGECNRGVHPGVALATIELKINYLEAVTGGRVRAEATVLRTGRNFVVTECEIFDRKGMLAAKALLTFGAASGHSLQK
jgi:acyl-coenzyme A thioesterase PaaI-like protein